MVPFIPSPAKGMWLEFKLVSFSAKKKQTFSTFFSVVKLMLPLPPPNGKN